MYARMVRIVFLLWFSSWILVARVFSQDQREETLSGPDSHETGRGPNGHLLGEWAACGLIYWNAESDSIFSM